MVTQSKYVLDLLIKFNMVYCKATPFPFILGISLEEGKTTPQVDSTSLSLVDRKPPLLETLNN